jgi:hypothetical protein
LPVCVQFSSEIEQNPLRVRSHGAIQRGDDGVLLAKRPSFRLSHPCHIIVSTKGSGDLPEYSHPRMKFYY